MPASIELNPDISMIWHLLLKEKIADEDQLEDVLDESVRNNQSFQTCLYNYEVITEDELLKLIANELGTEFVEVKPGEIPEEVIDSVPPDIARTYGIIPVEKDDESVTVIAENPFDPRLVDELHFVLEKDCHILVGRPREVQDALDTFYPEKTGSVSEVIKEMEELHKGKQEEDMESVADLEKAANEAPIVRFVNIILSQAIRDKASDIHFEPFADEFRIRYRIDGALFEMAPPPKSLAVPVISRIKVMSNLNIAERRLPQDGRIELRVNRKPIDLRVSSLPTRYGESVVLRVLDRTVVNLDLDSQQLVLDGVDFAQP